MAAIKISISQNDKTFEILKSFFDDAYRPCSTLTRNVRVVSCKSKAAAINSIHTVHALRTCRRPSIHPNWLHCLGKWKCLIACEHERHDMKVIVGTFNYVFIFRHQMFLRCFYSDGNFFSYRN